MIDGEASMSENKKIVVQNNTGPLEVEADVFGNWAAHKSVNESGWSVTCVPYGRRAANDLDKRAAVRLARRLNERVPDFRWSGKDDEMPHADDLAAVLQTIHEVRGW